MYAAIEKVRWNPNGRVGISSFAAIEPSLGEERSSGAHKVVGSAQETATGKEVENFPEDIFSVGTLGAVNYIVRGMRELPGRKAVMLFSEGFSLRNQGVVNVRLETPMRSLTELANRSGVIIYAADPRGLVPLGFSTEDDVSDKVQNPDNNYADAQLETRNAKFQESQQGLRTLAEATGGFAITNQNLGAWSIRQMLRDQNGYYLIGYQPDSDTFDPKKNRFNKLTVRVKRDDVKVRYRSGFFGITDENMRQAPKTAGQQIHNALTSPFGANGVNLNLYAISGNDAKTGDFIRSLVYIDAKDLKFTQEANGIRKANFDIIAMTFGDNGVPVDEVAKNYTIQVNENLYQKMLEKGFVYNLPIPIKKPGAYQFRIALRDSGSEKVGSVSQFVEVPNLKKKSLAVSKLILSNFTGEEWKKLISAKAQTSEQTDNQEKTNLDTTSRRFKRGTILRYDYVIYNAKSASGQNPQLQTQTRLFREGNVIVEGKSSSVSIAGQTDLQRIETSGAIMLGKDLLVGNYIIQIIITNSSETSKNRVSTQFVEFEIVE